MADSIPNTSSAEIVVGGGAFVPMTGSTVWTSESDIESERATLEGGSVITSSRTFRTPLELSWISDLFWCPLFSGSISSSEAIFESPEGIHVVVLVGISVVV